MLIDKTLSKFLLFTILYLGCGSLVEASPDKLKFRILSKEHGLSSSKAFCVFQDSRGYIWIGTNLGLNRYDGYKPITYQYDPNDSNTISSNAIECITEDKDHNIWIGTSMGLNKFNRHNNTFTRFLHSPNNKNSIANNVVTSLVCDDKGDLWIGTLAGLNLLKYRNSNLKRFVFLNDTYPHLNPLPVTSVYQRKNKSIWIGTDGKGLIKLTNNGHYKVFRKKQPGTIASDFITTIEEDKNGKLWVGTRDTGIFIFDEFKGLIRHFRKTSENASGLRSNVIKDILADSKGNLWVGTENGGFHWFDFSKSQFVHYEGNPLDPTSFSQKSAGRLWEDNQQNLWIASHGGGMFIYSPDRYKFDAVADYSQHGSLSYKDIKTFFEDDDGSIWIGTDGGGINVWNRKTNTFKVYRFNSKNPRSIGSDAILYITKDRQGTIWVGTWGGGLNRYNRNTNDFTRFVHDPNNPKSISSNNIWRIFEDSKGNFWIATYLGGINLFDRKTGTFSIFTGTAHQQNFITSKSFISINEDKEGNLWFGSEQADLYNYDIKKEQITAYFHPNITKSRSYYGNVEVILNDSKGRLWIGKNGLLQFNYKTRKFVKPNLSSKFHEIYIQGIIEDKLGYFWISTSDGLIKYHPDKGFFKKYSEADGLQSLEFSRNAYYKTQKGEILFGGNKGFNIFHPDSITTSKYAAPVYFTDFQIFNKSITSIGKDSPLKSHISEAKEVTLKYDQSLFSFEFASLNYVTPEKTLYAYKLEGFDKGWNYVGTQRKATYTNLNPGHYVFKVKAGNADGVWNTKPASINVTIIPPFWLTWWFKSVVFIVVVTVLFIFLYLKRKSEIKKLEERKKEEIHQSQLQFFTNISHELRTPLSLIIGPLQKVMQEDSRDSIKHSYQTMYRNAIRLMKLISEIIDFRKVESGALHLKVRNGDLALAITEIANDFSDRATELEIDFKVNATTYEEHWFDIQIIEKIIINLLTNSFKYTPKGGTVSIEVLKSLNNFKPTFENELILKSDYRSTNYAYIRVADNGVGISKNSIQHLFERYFRITQSHLGSGLGLAFVKSLTFLHKGEIYVYSEKNKGTEIIIGIPVGKNDYPDNERWNSASEEGIIQLESIRYKNEILLEKTSLTDIHNPVVSTSKNAQHILIVDDNEELRAFLKGCLESIYNVSEAADGVEGLLKAKDKSPDLILSDVMMPNMDGIEFCKHLKDDIETSHIPVILLTAKDAMETKISGVGHGADHYFSKPVNIDLLLLTINNIFEQRQKLKERYSRDYTIKAKELAHSAKDKEFIEKAQNLIEKQIENPELNVELLCKEIGMSPTTLLRKIKEITGQTINEFVRNYRLKKAIDIMTHEDVLITEVMYRVGISSPSYFSTIFKKEFGKTPTQFMQDLELKSKS